MNHLTEYILRYYEDSLIIAMLVFIPKNTYRRNSSTIGILGFYAILIMYIHHAAEGI